MFWRRPPTILSLVTFLTIVQTCYSVNTRSGVCRDTVDTHRCTNGRCIPLEWKCDRDNDCGDNTTSSLSSDEMNCTYADTNSTGSTTCLSSEFACRQDLDSVSRTLRCIPIHWTCDGENDCVMGDDELLSRCMNDQKEHNCLDTQFNCGQHPMTNMPICMPASWKCDGQPDCFNGSDEQDCEAGFEDMNNTTHPGAIAGLHDCKDDEIRCANGRCIMQQWQCDGDNDCGDNSDEPDNCPPLRCGDDQWMCVTNKYCVPLRWHCDGELDCQDKSDEVNCTSAPTHHTTMVECKENQHQCASGECILKSWLCDHEEDCVDGSDENRDDCKPPDGDECEKAEERVCPNVRSEVAGPNGHVYVNPVDMVCAVWCDGVEQCPNGEDEANCTITHDPANYDQISIQARACNLSTHFDCAHNAAYSVHVCLPLVYVCDGKPDCPVTLLHDLFPKDPLNSAAPDEDEALCKAKESAAVKCSENNGGCEHICLALPNVIGSRVQLGSAHLEGQRVCACREGYQLVEDNMHCQDINECELFGACTQLCVNGMGNYTCGCHRGYLLQFDNRTCKATGDDARLLLANRAQIREVDLRSNEYRPLATNLSSAIAIDFLYKSNTLIWSDVFHETIMSCKVEHLSTGRDVLAPNTPCTDKKELYKHANSTPDGLAVDWVHDLLFWTDTGHKRVNVLSLQEPHHMAVLHSKNLQEPRAIAIDPNAALVTGLIFWTDWGDDGPRIERSDMDGKKRMDVVSDKSLVQWPNGLAVDSLARRIYWADAKLKKIDSVDYDGDHLQRIVHSWKSIHHPFSLTVFEDTMYWSDWDNNGLYAANKFHGGNIQLLMRVQHLMSVRVYHELSQPELTNKCMEHNCEQMCLPAGHEFIQGHVALFYARRGFGGGRAYTCACNHDTHHLHADGVSCVLGATQDAMHAPDSAFAPRKQTGHIAFTTFCILLVMCLVGAGVGYTFYKRYEQRHLVPVNNFENPVYRHTTMHDDDQLYFDHALNNTNQNGASSRASAVLKWATAGGNSAANQQKHTLVLSEDDDEHTPNSRHNEGAVVYTDLVGVGEWGTPNSRHNEGAVVYTDLVGVGEWGTPNSRHNEGAVVYTDLVGVGEWGTPNSRHNEGAVVYTDLVGVGEWGTPNSRHNEGAVVYTDLVGVSEWGTPNSRHNEGAVVYTDLVGVSEWGTPNSRHNEGAVVYTDLVGVSEWGTPNSRHNEGAVVYTDLVGVSEWGTPNSRHNEGAVVYTDLVGVSEWGTPNSRHNEGAVVYTDLVGVGEWVTPNSRHNEGAVVYTDLVGVGEWGTPNSRHNEGAVVYTDLVGVGEWGTPNSRHNEGAVVYTDLVGVGEWGTPNSRHNEGAVVYTDLVGVGEWGTPNSRHNEGAVVYTDLVGVGEWGFTQ